VTAAQVEPHRYHKVSLKDEVPAVADAIRLYQQLVEADMAKAAGLPGPADVDARYIVGYLDGVARTMAVTDGWCQDAIDTTVWRECARANNAGPGVDGAYAYARGAAWRDYMRKAAESLAREVGA